MAGPVRKLEADERRNFGAPDHNPIILASGAGVDAPDDEWRAQGDAGQDCSNSSTAASEKSEKRKRKTESIEEESVAKPYECRFCPMKFAKSQALGGHMNRHRQEREREQYMHARQLVMQQQPACSFSPWTMPTQNTSGAASLGRYNQSSQQREASNFNFRVSAPSTPAMPASPAANLYNSSGLPSNLQWSNVFGQSGGQSTVGTGLPTESSRSLQNINWRDDSMVIPNFLQGRQPFGSFGSFNNLPARTSAAFGVGSDIAAGGLPYVEQRGTMDVNSLMPNPLGHRMSSSVPRQLATSGSSSLLQATGTGPDQKRYVGQTAMSSHSGSSLGQLGFSSDQLQSLSQGSALQLDVSSQFNLPPITVPGYQFLPGLQGQDFLGQSSTAFEGMSWIQPFAGNKNTVSALGSATGSEGFNNTALGQDTFNIEGGGQAGQNSEMCTGQADAEGLASGADNSPLNIEPGDSGITGLPVLPGIASLSRYRSADFSSAAEGTWRNMAQATQPGPSSTTPPTSETLSLLDPSS